MCRLDVIVFAEDVRFIPGPLPVSEVIYFQTNVDSTGASLDASTGNNYTITFQLPIPAKYFWSLIIYNATSLNLIDNPINRYSVSDRVRIDFCGKSLSSSSMLHLTAHDSIHDKCPLPMDIHDILSQVRRS